MRLYFKIFFRAHLRTPIAHYLDYKGKLAKYFCHSLFNIIMMFYDCQLIFVVAVYWDLMLTNENFCLHYVNECIYRIMFHVRFCHRELGYIWDHTLVKCPVYMWERDVKTCIRCPGLNRIIIVLSTQITQCLADVRFVYIFPPFKSPESTSLQYIIQWSDFYNLSAKKSRTLNVFICNVS